MPFTLSSDAKHTRVSNSVAASQNPLVTSILDMGSPQSIEAGFDAVAFIVLLNSMTSGSVLTATVQDNGSNSTSGMANVTAASQQIYQGNSADATVVQSAGNVGLVFTDVGGNSSNQFFIIEVAMLQRRYVQLSITIATANAAFDGILAIQYRSKWKPIITQDASLAGSGLFVAST